MKRMNAFQAYEERIMICILVLIGDIMAVRLLILPLLQPLTFISTQSQLLTNQTGTLHYQHSVPLGNALLCVLIWLGMMVIKLFLTPRIFNNTRLYKEGITSKEESL